MIRSLVNKVKNLFGQTPKKVSKVSEEKPKKEISSSNQQNPDLKKKNNNYHQRNRRKKETPEEYKARHAKLAEERKAKRLANQQNKKENVTAENRDNKPVKKKPVVSEIKSPVEKLAWNSSEFKVDVYDGKTRFHDLSMSEDILHAVFDLGFEYCTDVQAETLPRALMGEDVTAQAQTGTGKTAAFLITIFNHIINNPIKQKRKKGTPRALILAPTRELVLQIEKDALGLGKYVDCTILAVLGGIQYKKQIDTLKSKELDIVICTPGRLIDFMKQRLIDLRKVEILVIDEADRMLDMGFIPDVKKIVISTPQKAKRQTMFFTATMTGDVKYLAESWTRQAHDVIVESEDLTAKNIEQITYITTLEEKPVLLYNTITKNNLERVLIFANRRDDAKKLRETLDNHGISCALLTGDVDQKQRISRLENFREGKVRVLVATDVASRGIHVEGISHVINYNMPTDVEEYVHRIGRTGRAGANGISINFADEDESYDIPKLEEYLGKKLKCTFPTDDLLTPIPESVVKQAEEKKSENDKEKKQYREKKNFRPNNNNKKRPYKKNYSSNRKNNNTRKSYDKTKSDDKD